MLTKQQLEWFPLTEKLLIATIEALGDAIALLRKEWGDVDTGQRTQQDTTNDFVMNVQIARSLGNRLNDERNPYTDWDDVAGALQRLDFVASFDHVLPIVSAGMVADDEQDNQDQ